MKFEFGLGFCREISFGSFFYLKIFISKFRQMKFHLNQFFKHFQSISLLIWFSPNFSPYCIFDHFAGKRPNILKRRLRRRERNFPGVSISENLPKTTYVDHFTYLRRESRTNLALFLEKQPRC